MPRMPTSPFAPRSESAPAKSWDELSEDQRQAIDGIHEYLMEFMKEAASPQWTDPPTELPYGHFVPRLHEHRLSNILLLDGRRGTGKTTVMLTLLQIWKEALGAAPSAKLFQSIPKERPTVNCLALKQLVPLEILDMQPLSGDPSLLLQLAGRLYRVAEQLQPQRQYQDLVDGRRKPAWTREADQESESMKAWRQFARTVAVGTEDRPRERQAQLNPEDFAIELEQSECLRMRLQERWHAFVDRLCLDLAQRKELAGLPTLGPSPCFMIPIDDADMNPDRGVELLNLVRSLWHPHVVFLVTGEANLFRELLVAHYQRKPSKLPPSSAFRLARDVLGKVIPPGQRLPMRLNGADAFNLRNEYLPTELQVLLEKDSFLTNSLPRRWRVLRDLEQFSRAATRRSTLEAARVMLQEAVYDSALSQAEQEQLLDHVMRWNSERRELELFDENHLQVRTDSTALPVPVDNKRTVTCYRGLKSRWFLRGQEKAVDPQTAIPLSDPVVAALYLMSSLAAQSENVRHGSALSPSDFQTAQSTFVVQDSNYDFPWPTPTWVNPLDFRQFLQGWQNVLGKVAKQWGPSFGAASTRREVTEQLAAGFLRSILQIAATYLSDDPMPECNAELIVDWLAIGRQIAWLATREEDINSTKISFIRWAQTGAMLFTAKESGLHSEVRGKILDGWLFEIGIPTLELSQYWNLVNLVRNDRVERFNVATEKVSQRFPLLQQVEHAVQAIDAGFYSTKDAKSSFRSSETSEQSILIMDLVNCIDFMTPESEDAYISRMRSYSEPTTYNGLFFSRNHTPEQIKNNHYVAHSRLYTTSIFLRSIPSELPDYWCQLWPRIKLEATGLFYNKPDLLQILRDAINSNTARQAWRQIIENYVQRIPGVDEGKLQNLSNFLSSIESTATRRSFISFSEISGVAKRSASSKQYALFDYIETSTMEFDLSKLPEIVSDINSENSDSQLISRAIEKYHDIVIDEENQIFLGSEEELTELCTPTTWPVGIENLSGENWSVKMFPITVPYWFCVLDHELSLRSYGSLRGNLPKWWFTQGDDVTSALGVAMPEGVAYCILSIFVIIALERRVPEYDGEYLEYVRELKRHWKLNKEGLLTDTERIFWNAVNHRVAALYNKRHSGRRWAAVRAWADLGAPLFATPECGMESNSAEQWLRAWDSTPNSIEHSEVRRRLRESRRKRVTVALQRANKPAEQADVTALIHQVNQDFAAHAWVRLIENRE